MEPTLDPQQPQTSGQGMPPQPGVPAQPGDNTGVTVEGYVPGVNAGFAQPPAPAAIPEPTLGGVSPEQGVAMQPQAGEPVVAQGQPVATMNQGQGVQDYQQPVVGVPQTQLQNESVQGEDPGKTMSIVALILAFLMPLVGLILGFVARSKSKKAGRSNGLAVGAIVVGGVMMAISTLILGLTLMSAVARLQENAATCRELGPGRHIVDGSIIECRQ